MTAHTDRRLNMVNGQIRTNRVTDARVIDALLAIPRERFVAKSMAGIAYLDEDFDLGNGRYLMSPMIFARLLQAAAVVADDIVLDISPATGYSSAVLAQLAATVVALEADEALSEQAAKTHLDLSADNIAAIHGDIVAGLAGQGPYDVIFVNGAVAQPPKAWLEQLAEGGRMVLVERPDEGGVGRAVLYGKLRDGVSRRELFDARAMPLAGFKRESEFTF